MSGLVVTVSKFTHLVGNIKRVKIAGQSYICLLLSIRADEGIDLCRLDIIQPLDSLTNLPLVGFNVNNEHECIVLFDLFHRALRVEWRDDGAELVHSWDMGDRGPWILGSTR